jgi:hypothetical protein
MKELLDSIRAGKYTADQMEDIVYAIHAAYVDHNKDINEQLSEPLEYVADKMVQARRNATPLNVEGV